MYRQNSFIQLSKSYLAMIITFILVFDHIITISSESITSQTWSNIIQDLSLKIHDYKSDDKTMESHPLNEGFILFSNDRKKSLSITSNSDDLSPVKRIFQSHNISSTTCKTITIVKTVNHTSRPIVDHSVGHLGRRLLNEPNYDTDMETSSIKTAIETDDEIESFLKVDDEKLSKELFNIEVTVDGSGDTTEETTEQTSEITTMSTTTSSTTSVTLSTTTTAAPTETMILSNNTRFIIVVNCTIANTTLHQILEKLNQTPYNDVTYDDSELPCNDSEKIQIILNFITGDNITRINDLFETLENIAATLDVDIEVFSHNTCGNNETVPVINVNSCHLINMCNLCGVPARGICDPKSGLSKCKCFVNEDDPSRPYSGDRCFAEDPKPITRPYFPSSWTPIIVGVLLGLATLLSAITFCLWAMEIWRGRTHYYDQGELRIPRLWHLPRVQMPTTVTAENVQSYLNNTISTLSSNRSDITDSTFFKELDQKMGENLRATITRPNTSSMLASLPSDTVSIQSSYDPIDELDAIIDNEDIDMTFHDPLNELYEDNDSLEFVNPNLQLPRPNTDAAPRGLFSFFYGKS